MPDCPEMAQTGTCHFRHLETAFIPNQSLTVQSVWNQGCTMNVQSEGAFLPGSTLARIKNEPWVHSPTSVPGSFQVIKEEGSGLRFPMNGKRSVPFTDRVTFQSTGQDSFAC